MEKKACSAAGEWTTQDLECKVSLICCQPELASNQWRECHIYRVPSQLRAVKDEAYTPKIVSIGPFHHGRKELKDMEIQKVIYFNKFCERTKKTQTDLVTTIERMKEQIGRRCSETLEVTKAFVEIILMDAIFIIELFLRYSKNPDDKTDYILSKPWLVSNIADDLILLENQLPYFVLKELYKFAYDTPFLELACKYLKRDIKKQRLTGNDPLHFTDLGRTDYLPLHLNPTVTVKRPPSATKLDNAGVKIKEFRDRGLLEIQFQKNKCLKKCPFLNCSWFLNCLPCLKCSTCFARSMQPLLEIPPFTIDDRTERIFRNLMAFEQCHYPWESYICNYVSLLGCLINKEEDVNLLVEKKVIVNWLGSNAEVMTLINKLGHEIVEVKSCYNDFTHQLNDHCGNSKNRNMLSLITAYFSDIWRGTASFIGLFALLLTLWNFLIKPFVM